jgi:hypothetical protein
VGPGYQTDTFGKLESTTFPPFSDGGILRNNFNGALRVLEGVVRIISHSIGHFQQVAAVPLLTRGPESSKSELFGSPKSIRTEDLLVNSQVFETLCLRRRGEYLPVFAVLIRL